ncbi:hypothetical protein FVEG_01674 [Fusarium verticillioides 7600]|uniref:Uncharacterized protein n=1 Tax=Gibberella moniliformis (strain M3125 / FGSC 7600) TaxID=334819 RepID=W7LGC1_GIBM7|nr:hypothetical protein FVEG_01674 [Fusarium verticillioides 7600]EWG38468.1 hypothetical protein FVEG_01674 [Fusarium verticillioides 7600]
MGEKMTDLSYVDYVKRRAQSNPCINGLTQYLERQAACASNIVKVDYPNALFTSSLDPIRVEVQDLPELVHAVPSATTRFLLIEDINPQLIAFLGKALDIDPIFFADYVNTCFENIEVAAPPPSLAILPSLLSQHGYLHLHYQQVLSLGDAKAFEDVAYALKTHTNITRNIRRLAPLSGIQLALVRASCALLMREINDARV